MNRNIPKHFSSNFKLDIDNLPAKSSDRINFTILLPGIFFGAVLFSLGLFELLNGLNNTGHPVFDKLIQEAGASQYHSFLSPRFFDIVIMIIGLGIISSLVFSNIRYKKIFFDGQNVTIINRPVWGAKKTTREKIENYEGVLLRIEFFQYGFITKNKYIVELYHKNPQKIAPVYISTSEKHIRKIWEGYAKKLNLPAFINTDEGMVKREVRDLDKSLKEMAEIWDLKKQFNSNTRPSSHIAIVKKDNKTIIKSRKIVWDAYNFLAWLFILMFVLATTIVSFNTHNFSATALSGFYGVGGIGMLVAVFILFRKDKLVIKKDKIVNTHKYMLFSTKHNEINKKDIVSVEVSVNPATERCFVAIISDDKTIIYGKKMPLNDLKWVKKFLINEIVNS